MRVLISFKTGHNSESWRVRKLTNLWAPVWVELNWTWTRGFRRVLTRLRKTLIWVQGFKEALFLLSSGLYHLRFKVLSVLGGDCVGFNVLC